MYAAQLYFVQARGELRGVVDYWSFNENLL